MTTFFFFFLLLLLLLLLLLRYISGSLDFLNSNVPFGAILDKCCPLNKLHHSYVIPDINIYDMIYIYIYTIYLTAIWLTPGGSSTSHIYTQIVHLYTNTTHNTEKGELGSAGRAPSLRVIPWHLPYN
jgi:hypothetical protein